MTPAPFSIRTTTAFDREFRKLAKHHRNLIEHYGRALNILASDPYNRSREHDIKKLEGVPPCQGQYRIRLGRFRFRYDIAGRVVTLAACSLRREDTYA
jgi:mRNA-degrading endonuclease RelE of RelBE toxin-antitoxin system